MADLKGYLDSLPVDDNTRHDAWDGFYASKDPTTFQAKFDKLNIPQNAKADLFDAAFNQKALGTYTAPVATHAKTFTEDLTDLVKSDPRDTIMHWMDPDLSGNHPIKNTALGMAQGVAGMILHPVDAQLKSGATEGMYPSIAPTGNKARDLVNQKELQGTNTPQTRLAQEQIEQFKQSPAHFAGSLIGPSLVLGGLHLLGGEAPVTETGEPITPKTETAPVTETKTPVITPNVSAVKNAQISVEELRTRAKARYEARMAAKPHEGLKPGEILRSPEGNMMTPADTGGFHEHMDDGSLRLHTQIPEGTKVDIPGEEPKPVVPEDTHQASNPSVEPTAVEGRSPEVQQAEAAVYPALGKAMRLQQLRTGHQFNMDSGRCAAIPERSRTPPPRCTGSFN